MPETVAQTATRITALAGGEFPEWGQGRLSSLLVDEPDASVTGFSCDGAIVGYLNVACREHPPERTIYVAPGTFDAATTYQAFVGLGGLLGSDTTLVDATFADAEAIVDYMVLLEPALQAVYPNVTVTKVETYTDDFGRVHAMAARFRGIPSIWLATSGGAGTWAVDAADPIGARVQLWARMATQASGTAPPVWTRFGEPMHCGPEGLQQRLTLAGVDRLYPQVISGGNALDGPGQFNTDAFVTFGPATIGS